MELKASGMENNSAEHTSNESEEKFRIMVDNIPNLAWMARADGWIYWYNKQWYSYTGTTPDQMEGWGWQSVHNPETLPDVILKWQQCIAAGEEFEMVFPIKGADGKFRQFLTRIVPIKDELGKIYQWLGTNTDITRQKQIEFELNESRQRFQHMVRQAPLGIAILRGSEFLVEMANEAYLQLVDRREEEFVGRPLFAGLPEVKDAVEPLLNNVLKTGIPYRGFEVPLPVKRSGKQDIFYFDFVYHPLKDADGSIDGIIVTVTDVTEKVTARLKVEENEKRYHNLIYSSPSAIGILTGEDLIITIGNDAIFEIWGKGKEIIDQPYFEALPELAEQGYKEIFSNVYKTGVPFNAIETPVKIFQNCVMTLKYYNFLLYPQKDINGKIDGIGIIATEVTSQALFNKQIQESEERFRLLADSMPQFIWTADAEGNLTYFNQSVFDYSGLSKEQINKDGFLQIIHLDERERNVELWTQSIKTGKEFLYEHRFRKHTGEFRWWLSRAIPLKDESGNIQMWVGTSTDIEEQKTFAQALEKQVQERTKELAQNNIELEKMNKELQSFAYISSHDLQEPLRKIQTFTGRIIDTEEKNLSARGKDYFKRMQDAALRMQTLIEDLLAYSRTNTSDRKFENTKLTKIIEAVKDDLKEELEQKQATVEIIDFCEINIIPFQFHQLLLNLISNSLKFSKPSIPLHIKIASEMAEGAAFKTPGLQDKLLYCHISIADNGIGFEQRYAEKIFDLFQRLHGKHEYNGTGIGLAIVKKIVENHEGIITATGELNKGATFDIYIPAAK